MINGNTDEVTPSDSVIEFKDENQEQHIFIHFGDPDPDKNANINYTITPKPDADDEEIVRAAKNAYADVFIDGLGGGYDALVGDRGERLSGGERQRIALARAFLKDAPIIILDEATASLDSESEAMIQKALEKLLIGRTTIIIAHRLSTLKSAEQVIILDRGNVEAYGDFEQLLSTSEKFRRLYAT